MLPFVLLISYALIEAFTTTSQALSVSGNASLLWGPYRPNLYVGMRPRIPNSLLMGLMWSKADDPLEIARSLRHTCEQDEGMAGYGWTAYDVRKGGMQVINDTGNQVDLITMFAKVSGDEPNGSWGLRVKGFPRADAPTHQKTTIVFYLGSEDSTSKIECMVRHPSNSGIVCNGTAASLGSFKLQIPNDGTARESQEETSIKSLTVPADSIWQAKLKFLDQLKGSDSHEGMISDEPGQGNLHFVQKTFKGGFEFDMLFSSSSASKATTSDSLTEGLRDVLSMFSQRFKLAYTPQAPFQEEPYLKLSQSLLSNLMGGIGYFYGKSRIDVSSVPEYAENGQDFWDVAALARSRAVVEEQGPFQLFSAVPSRPFFPRGFLWDEGFHLQVIMDWDMDLALEIVLSWFDLMDDNGWIAREQILGPEARSKVPSEFQTQYPHYANPPTLFLVVQAFVERFTGMTSYSGSPSHYLSDPATGKAFLKAIYPKLKNNYAWFCRTQAGNLTRYQLADTKFHQGYRWRGRTPQHIFTSGLDDYPRAQPPHPEELHVDALCWVGSMSEALKEISAFLGEEEDQKLFLKHRTDIVGSIDGIHWSEPNQAYCDTTVVDGNQVEQVCHKGYISLFPFLVGLIGPEHSHLGAVLDLIRNPEELWSPHGLRSLSLKDKYYGTDENYWRGPVWVPINYMALQRLLALAQQPGQYQRKARKIYTELRLNLVKTVFESWKETGFAWEQYNPDTGKGQRTQHFTGWTSLIVRVMAMPDLQSRPQPLIPGLINQPIDLRGWSTKPTLTLMAVFLIIFVFRKRLMRIWRGSIRS